MFELIKAVGLGLVVLLPLANPLTTVVLFLALGSRFSYVERNRVSMQTSLCVFIILLVAWYGGKLVMRTFGISIPGLRIAGGLIVAYIGFRMLFPAAQQNALAGDEGQSEEAVSKHDTSIAFIPLAMPGTAGPGTIAMVISSASTLKHGVNFPEWVITVAPPLIFLVVSLITWICLRSAGAIMRMLGNSGIDAISRLMGFLLVCMGVQFVINGILEIFSTYPR
ncbi:MarC family NAAT transporter [Pantoea sp. R13S299]|uniref:MarC family NAAT transporter n=1 Tax=Pantoea sp. R13S299 TaxID=3402751 RepID=UPI003AD91061